MDFYEATPQRHKRSFREMSQATLSPSPMNFVSPATSNFFAAPRFGSAAADNIPSFFERRRTSHPHNQHSQRGSEEMADRSQSQLRPRLEHRASQTVIDLTDEPEDAPPPPRNHESQRPPQLGRSDAVNLMDLIDLTDDSGDAEIMITGERRLPETRPQPRPRQVVAPADREDSPGLFMPPGPGPASVPRSRVAHVQGVIGRQHAIGAIFGLGQRDLMAALGQDNINFAMPRFNMGHNDAFMAQLHHHAGAGQHQAMPGAMNYGHPAWGPQVNQKPDHVPPPKARENFTRSPTENDVVICPSCELELVQTKDTEEPVVKKGGKAPTRKEREEHPFWVVKECGHVYCNSCYQLRQQASKHSHITFREPATKSTKKKTLCAVEDCDADVKDKSKWVGVFL